jgi:hypothetical protein
VNDAETEAHFEHNIDVAWKHFLNKERKMFGEGFLYGWLCGTDNLDESPAGRIMSSLRR